MSSRLELLRLELAAFALAATVVLIMLVVTLDAVRFHLPALEATASGTVPLLVALGVEALIVVVFSTTIARQAVRQRALRKRLPGRSMMVHGSEVFVMPTSRPLAFCVGLLRPRIYLSEGLLGDLSASELLSVVAHERHHARRRDPLRAVVAKATAQALWFVPTVKTAASTQATIAELAADQFAIRTAGAQPLASALAAFASSRRLERGRTLRADAARGKSPPAGIRRGRGGRCGARPTRAGPDRRMAPAPRSPCDLPSAGHRPGGVARRPPARVHTGGLARQVCREHRLRDD